MTPSADAQPPADPEAERAVLGRCMHDPAAYREAADLIGREDFVRPAHQLIWDVLGEQVRRGDPTSPVALRAEIERLGQLQAVRGGDYLFEVAGSVPPGSVDYYADLMVRKTRLRRAKELAVRVGSAVAKGEDPEVVEDLIRAHAEQAQGRSFGGAAQAIGVELEDFLKQVPPEPDWLVPGLLERQDRLILTGGEGKGKSTLLRQIGVQLASGLHPFGGPGFAPLRVLLLDLENTRAQIHRKISPLYAAALEHYKGGMTIAVRPEGLDLSGGDGTILEAEVAAAQPDLVITGPIYKMVAGDPTEEGPARLVASWLDKLRTRYGCAILLEAHSPHASNGNKRPTRPYGASLWLRWPEFGLHLGEDGTISHWRGPRDERDWPAMLQRGGKWPWTPVTRPRDLLWARIVDYCTQLGERPSIRELAKLTGVGPTTVQRAIEEHRTEWNALEVTE